MNEERKGFPKRVILEKRHGRLGHEEQILETAANFRNIPVEYLTEKVVARGFAKFEPTDLVSGSISFIKHALRAYGVTLSEVQFPDYPEVLDFALRRTIRKDLTLNQAKTLLDKGDRLFVKPQDCKIFTGFVASDSSDPRFNGVSGQRKVFVCEPVQFLTEWRYYVANGRIGPKGNYAGDPDQTLSFSTVTSILEKLYDAGIAPAGFVADFGLLPDYSIALIEINDGFSVGYYGDHPAPYWDMISARWQELIGVRW